MQEQKKDWGTMFWGGFLVVGALAISIFWIYSGWQQLDTWRHWDEYQQVDGELMSFDVYEIETQYQDKGTVKTSVTWQVKGDYFYIVDGNRYDSYVTLEIEHNESDARALMMNHQAGEGVKVWYHPDRPSEPILEYEIPTLGSSVWFMGLGVLVILLFGGWTVDYLRKK